MAKRIIDVVCLQECADSRVRYEKDVVYSLPVDHPCMQYFKPVTYTTDPGDLGPAGVILKKEGEGG